MIDFDLGNALLPTMDWDDFCRTDTYQLLRDNAADCAVFCELFSAGELSELEFSSNPAQGYHTMYEQDDFDEIVAFIVDNGKFIELPKNIGKKYQKTFFLYNTSVGMFAICRNESNDITGVLNKR